MQFYTEHPNLQAHLTESEREIVLWLNMPLTAELYTNFSRMFPFCTLQYHPALSLGEFVFHIIFTHVLFRVPGLGLYMQLIGFPMGTNCAAQWANAILRMYERLSPPPVHWPYLYVLRFIDDDMCIHPPAITVAELTFYFKSVYPTHLSFEWLYHSAQGGVEFLDVRIIRLRRLISTVYFKPTHTCCYIPWSSNHPRSTKMSWIKAEIIRFLRICSHQIYFQHCTSFLVGALKRLGYPAYAFDPLPISWQRRSRYLERTMNLQRDIIHVVRIPHHSAIPIAWSALVRTVQNHMKPLLPQLRLYAILKPSLNIRKIMLAHKNRTLRRPELEARETRELVDLLLNVLYTRV